MISKLYLLILTFLFSLATFAQAPGGVPYGEPEPVKWDLANIVLLIVIPVVILFVYFKRKKKK
ncbi:MAG: hypothetical protein ACK5M7_21850 [Draconibacterium sp.]